MQEPLFKLAINETAPNIIGRLGIPDARYAEIFQNTLNLIKESKGGEWLELTNKALASLKNMNEVYVVLDVIATAHILDSQPELFKSTIMPMRKILQYQRKMSLVSVILSNLICNICYLLTENRIVGIGVVVMILYLVIATYLFERNMKSILFDKQT